MEQISVKNLKEKNEGQKVANILRTRKKAVSLRKFRVLSNAYDGVSFFFLLFSFIFFFFFFFVVAKLSSSFQPY